MTAREAAREIGVSPFLIHRRIRDGSLPGLRIVGKSCVKATYRIKRSDFEEFKRLAMIPDMAPKDSEE
jgi:excisionase family DNA binding protein